MKKTVETVELKDLDFNSWKEEIISKIGKIIEGLYIPNGFDIYMYQGVFEETVDTTKLLEEVDGMITSVVDTLKNKEVSEGRECLTYEISISDYQTSHEELNVCFLSEVKINILNSQRGGGTATGIQSMTLLVANTTKIKSIFDKKINSIPLDAATLEFIYEDMEEEYIYRYSFDTLIDNHVCKIADYVKSNIKDNWDNLTTDFIFDEIISDLAIITELLSVEEQEYTLENDIFVVKYNEQDVIKIRPIVSYEVLD